MTALTEIRDRHLRLYTGAISDMLDKSGYRRQYLPNCTPMTIVRRLARPALTGQGYLCRRYR